eukprot:12895783-Prorocentrum_lima.AAC.1
MDGATLASPKKNNCCWFGSSFVLLQQQHQGQAVTWTVNIWSTKPLPAQGLIDQGQRIQS